MDHNHKSRSPEEKAKAEGLREHFRLFAHATSCVVGSPGAFLTALLVVAVWGATGPIFNYSDTWQLIINTSTTIVTFLMVFLIQSTQNRDSRAIHLKLDELLRAMKGARNAMVDLEALPDEDLDRLEKQFKAMRDKASKVKEERHQRHSQVEQRS